jgi:alkaline phosphatase
MKQGTLAILFLVLSSTLFVPSVAIGTHFTQTFENEEILVPHQPLELFRNVILMIGDGMGWGQINATRKSLEQSQSLALDDFPLLREIDTYSLDNLITDSAAAATAYASGELTNNGMISMTPGGVNLTTILETAESLGKSTGLVTTTRLTHATPAAFASHVSSRSLEAEIARQMIAQDIDVLLGGGLVHFSSLTDHITNSGYTLIENRSQLLASESLGRLFGIFTWDHMNYEDNRNQLLEPHIAEMTNISLQILERNSDGFFLMIEGGRIDHACHANDINNTIGDTIAFDQAVKIALNYTQRHADTLLIVSADHECGGLMVNMTNPELEYEWTSTYHTSAMVPAFIYCSDLSTIPAFNHTSDIGSFLFEAFYYLPEIPVIYPLLEMLLLSGFVIFIGIVILVIVIRTRNPPQ